MIYLSDEDSKYDPKNVKLSRNQWLLLALLGAISGCIVGQAIDNAYPMSGALHYISFVIEVPFLGHMLEFVWWVPLLYGVAGALIVVLITVFSKILHGETGNRLLDKWVNRKPRFGYDPHWGIIIVSILMFVFQWFMGCHLHIFINNAWLFAILVLWGLAMWWIFDGTDAGLIVCLITVTLGPLIEITEPFLSLDRS